MKEIKGKYLLVLIAMCGVIGASLGMTTNVTGIYITPVAEAFGVGKGAVSMTLTICNIVYSVGGILAARIISKDSYKRVVFISALFLTGSTAGMGLCSSIWQLYICSAIRGFAAGTLGIVLATMVLNNWFIKNSGIATSFAFGCSGIVGAVFSPILSSIISSYGWRMGYYIAALITILLYLPAFLLPISFSPETYHMKALGTIEDSTMATKRVIDTVKHPINHRFVFMVALFAVIYSFATAMPTHLPGLAEAYSLSVGALMLSICMVANTGGKILLGVLIDHIGERKSILFYAIAIICGTLLMAIVPSNISMLVGAGLFGLSYSVATVGTVVICKTMFGLENYRNIYPKISVGTTIANAAGASIIGYIYDFTGSYLSSLYLILIMVCVSIVIISYCYRNISNTQLAEGE